MQHLKGILPWKPIGCGRLEENSGWLIPKTVVIPQELHAKLVGRDGPR